MKINVDSVMYEKFEDLANDTFPGLTMYVRDVDLDPICFAKYKPGIILREKAFTDASNRVMGMMTTHRIAILSNHMSDLREFEHGTNWGLFVANRDSHFKVLDVYEYNKKIQILLLHLPNDTRWKLFENNRFSLEENLIQTSRERFMNKSILETCPELATRDWIERCAFPIGMNHEGSLYDLDILLEE